MFKAGQAVIVLLLFNLKTDGAATVVREVYSGRDRGKFIVDIPNIGCMVVEAERLRDAADYWREVKNGRDNLTKIEVVNSKGKA